MMHNYIYKSTLTLTSHIAYLCLLFAPIVVFKHNSQEKSSKELHASGHSIDHLRRAWMDGARKVTQPRLVTHHLVEMHQGRTLPTICLRC